MRRPRSRTSLAQQLGSGSSGHATQSVVQGVRRRAVVLMLGLVLSEYHCLLTFVARRRGRILEIVDLDAKSGQWSAGVVPESKSDVTRLLVATRLDGVLGVPLRGNVPGTDPSSWGGRSLREPQLSIG